MTIRATRNALALFAALLALGGGVAGAQDPGTPIPLTSEASDNKMGAVLFYNFYTSNGLDPSSVTATRKLSCASSYDCPSKCFRPTP